MEITLRRGTDGAFGLVNDDESVVIQRWDDGWWYECLLTEVCAERGPFAEYEQAESDMATLLTNHGLTLRVVTAAEA